MFNLLISLGAAAVTFCLFFLVGHLAVGTSLFPTIIVAGVAYFLLARRSLKQLEVIVNEGQAEIVAASTGGTPNMKRVDAGLARIKEAFPIGRWQFLIAPQVHATLGQYLYMLKRFDEAEPHLEKSFVRVGQAHAMLGALHFQRKNYDKMIKVFDNAVAYNKKDGFVWSLYAYCLDKAGMRPKALEVLGNALKENPDDEKLKVNQAAIQNNERIRMKAYGQMWWAYHLEPPPLDIPPGMRGQLTQRKGYRSRPTR